MFAHSLSTKATRDAEPTDITSVLSVFNLFIQIRTSLMHVWTQDWTLSNWSGEAPLDSSVSSAYLWWSQSWSEERLLLMWQIELSQSSWMTTFYKSQVFPVVRHTFLCGAQFLSPSTQNLFLTWFSVTLLSLILFRTQLQVTVPPLNIQSAISSLETSLSDIQTWMLENKLNNKKEAQLKCSSSKTFSVCKPTTISSCGCEMSFSSSARMLGFYITDDMSVELHRKNVCWSAYSELCHISTVWHLLSIDSTKTLVFIFVLSRLDYCNSLLSGCPKHRLEKIQKVKNSAARLILKTHKQDHVSPLLRTLHWLPILSVNCQHSATPFSLM